MQLIVKTFNVKYLYYSTYHTSFFCWSSRRSKSFND